MKPKTKSLLVLAGVTTLMAGAAGTSTFAWIQVNRAVTSSFTNLGVKTNRASLHAEWVPMHGESLGSDKTKLDVNSGQATYDVSSGNGLAFYSPEWEKTDGNDKPVTAVRDVTSEVGVAYAEAGLKLYATSQGDSVSNLDLYLTAETLIKSTSNHAEDWTRVALLKSSGEPGSGSNVLTHVVTFEKGSETLTKDKFIKQASGPAESLALTTFAAENVIHAYTPFKDYHQGHVDGSTSQTDPAGSPAFKIGALTGATPAYFVVRVWMEGTEANNQEVALDETISVDLGITGVDRQ
ncbi:MAG: hypothetical protein ACI4UT_00405 [Candidatus Enteromonas sp.]